MAVNFTENHVPTYCYCSPTGSVTTHAETRLSCMVIESMLYLYYIPIIRDFSKVEKVQGFFEILTSTKQDRKKLMNTLPNLEFVQHSLLEPPFFFSSH